MSEVLEVVDEVLLDPKTQADFNKLPLIEQTVFLWQYEWLRIKAHAHQIEPHGDWSIWLMLAGRGAGKTRASAETIGWWAWSQPKTRWLVSAPTSGDLKGTCFEGDSGLLTVIPPMLVEKYNSSLHEIHLINGSFIKGIPASEPERFRGPQFHGGWLDELAAWEYLQESWDMIMFGIRLGTKTKLICSTTPKPKDLILDLIGREGDDVVITRASTYSNIKNLAQSFQKQILQYESTKLGRQEIYADDGTAKASIPYSVSERSYNLNFLQPQGPNRHAVFFSHTSETIDFHYERNSSDPRISHALTLAVDEYGNVLKSVAIGYQRRSPAFDEQSKTLAALTESQYTKAVFSDYAYRTPLPAEVKTYELTAPMLTGAKPLDFSTINGIVEAASEIPYEAQPSSQLANKRLIKQLRTLYRKDDLSGLLAIYQLDPMALPGESYKLALTSGLFNIFQTKASPAELTALLAGPEAQYRDLDGNGRFWIPSGQVFYSPTPDCTRSPNRSQRWTTEFGPWWRTCCKRCTKPRG